MNAKSTLINIAIRVGIAGLVWTGLNACSTANAFVVFDQNDATLFKMTGSSGAAANTRRICTVVTSFRAQLYANIGISSVNHFLYPITAKSQWNVVFGLAGNHTIAAADAFTRI
jgi:hypothetical protein